MTRSTRLRYSETPVAIGNLSNETPFILRRENDDWLAFNTVSCVATNLGRVSLSDIELPGTVVRTIDHGQVEGALSAPLKLFVSVSDKCNLSCEHCMSSSSPDGENKLTNTDLMDIADEAADAGVFQITIGGGEPLIYRGIWDVIGYMRSKHLGVSLTTNGLVVRDSDIENLRKFNVKTNVSIDGAPSTHDRIRRKLGAYERTVANIRRMIAGGVLPDIRYTLMNSNLQDADHMISLASELGLPLRPRRAKPSGRVLEGSEIITEPTHEYFEAVLKLNNAADCGLEDMMSLNPTPNEDYVMRDTDCGAGTRLAFIDEDGSMSPCSFLGQDFKAGKWQKGKLMEAWQNAPEFKEIRNLKQNEECSGCSRSSSCHSECPSMRLHAGGSLDAQDPGCIKPLVQYLGHTIERKHV